MKSSRNANRIMLVAAMTLQLFACGPADTPAPGSDLAVLAQQVEGYAEALPGKPLVFPRDHGPHPDYRIEWWYLTANLSDAQGELYGAQWTLFRVATRPRDAANPQGSWQKDQVFMAHMAITTPEDHLSFQRYARGAEAYDLARAGVETGPFSAWLDDWVLQSHGEDWLPLEVSARQGNYAFRLNLQSESPLVLQGESGFSQKNADGGGSFYYSQPFLQAEGSLWIDGREVPVSGNAWLDREWSSQFLQAGQAGWDWFSLHLDNGEKLMLFQLRQQHEGNATDNFLHAGLIAADGSVTTLDPQRIGLQALRQTSVAGRDLPLHWRIELPQIGRQFDIEPLHPDQWLDVDFPYWEGVIFINGAGPENSGRGYMELTGYPATAERH
ncbi:MAG: iron ABC transporter permease [Gammaproteobacteria bacterium]|nr:iron ABC transporter permease [Gammaproteobacteria bacterium]